MVANTKRPASQRDEDDAAQEEAELADNLSQIFCVTCSFCGNQSCSHGAIGQAADYNDRFGATARFVAKGWEAMTKTNRSRKLRPACPSCLKRKLSPNPQWQL
jgi:hypothetical protein